MTVRVRVRPLLFAGVSLLLMLGSAGAADAGNCSGLLDCFKNLPDVWKFLIIAGLLLAAVALAAGLAGWAASVAALEAAEAAGAPGLAAALEAGDAAAIEEALAGAPELEAALESGDVAAVEQALFGAGSGAGWGGAGVAAGLTGAAAAGAAGIGAVAAGGGAGEATEPPPEPEPEPHIPESGLPEQDTQLPPPPDSVADSIANGHSYDKHVGDQGEFPEIHSQAEFKDLISSVVNNPTQSGNLSDGRSYYYDQPSNTLVIVNPNSSDGGTCFRPTMGTGYISDLLK
ncbi:MAG: hypothetical protein ACYDAB_14490 [bacterium]